MFEYVPKNFDHLKKINSFSERQISDHLKLYEGYVENTNKLLKAIEERSSEEQPSPEFSELTRRLGYEYNGMILHELYFENLAQDTTPTQSSPLYKKIQGHFGSFQKWKQNFRLSALIRGNGWVILYHNTSTDTLTNFWIDEHQNGHPAGLRPIIVMDVWEHAFALDFGVTPPDRKAYIETFFENIDWRVAEARLIEETVPVGKSR